MKKRGSKKAKQQGLWSRVKSKATPWVKSHPKTTVVLVIIAVSLLWYGLVVFADYLQFKSVEPRMNKLDSSIVEALGAPKSEKTEGFCDHASAKFQKGQLNCYYGFSIKYPYSTHEDAQTRLKQFNDALSSSRGIKTIQKINYSQEIEYKSVGGGISYDLHDWTLELDCSVSINIVEDYEAGPIGHTDNGSVYARAISIGGSCSKGDMRQPIYPVKD